MYYKWYFFCVNVWAVISTVLPPEKVAGFSRAVISLSSEERQELGHMLT